MSKRIELVTGFSGLTVVWVDDRVLLTEQDVETISNAKSQAGVTRHDLISINRVWADAVQNNMFDELREGDSQSFASAAIALKGVCEELHCNLSLVDFRTAHHECFGDKNALFLLDLQNLTAPLGLTSVDSVEIDRDWNWELYGAHCVLHYSLAKPRYRFLSRFRNDKADAVSGILPRHFKDFGEVEQWSFRHDLPHPLASNFRMFVKANLIHAEHSITELLLWFRELPLADNPNDNHNSLDKGDALQCVRERLGGEFNSESAKALCHSASPWLCDSSAERPIRVSDLKRTFKAIELTVELHNMNDDDWLRLPCQPGLPFLLSLKALIYQMLMCGTYHPPTVIVLAREEAEEGNHAYTLTLTLGDKDKRDNAVSMEKFKNDFEQWVASGRLCEGDHFTRQRIGDLEYCRVALTDGSILCQKETAFKGAPNAALKVEFGSQSSPSIMFHWKAKKS